MYVAAAAVRSQHAAGWQDAGSRTLVCLARTTRLVDASLFQGNNDMANIRLTDNNPNVFRRFCPVKFNHVIILFSVRQHKYLIHQRKKKRELSMIEINGQENLHYNRS